jgi:hypothetical protein
MKWASTPTGLRRPQPGGHNPVGVGTFCGHIPRVARASRLRCATARHAQPWAERRNPFGIGRRAHFHYPQVPSACRRSAKGANPYQPGPTAQEQPAMRTGGLKARSNIREGASLFIVVVTLLNLLTPHPGPLPVEGRVGGAGLQPLMKIVGPCPGPLAQAGMMTGLWPCGGNAATNRGSYKASGARRPMDCGGTTPLWLHG